MAEEQIPFAAGTITGYLVIESAAAFTTRTLAHAPIPTPRCHNMQEHPSAAAERARLNAGPGLNEPSTPLSIHLSHGLAYTIGSALGSAPPSVDACLAAFTVENKAGLTAGARAWTKHAHRSGSGKEGTISSESAGWWGTPSGPVAVINEKALALFWKVTTRATWRNLHWLPHTVLVYEVRVPEGYGMRWSQDRSGVSMLAEGGTGEVNEQDGKEMGEGRLLDRPWIFRGFVEPMMENGHEVGWKH